MKLWYLFVFVLITSCANSNEGNIAVDQTVIFDLDNMSESEKLDSCYDFQILPLDTCRDALISSVFKMEVKKNGIYIFDHSSLPTIYSFDSEGKFRNIIGKIGHKKEEYYDIDCFTSSQNGDSIYLVQYNLIKIYDSSGKFIKQGKTPFEGLIDDILCTDNGLITGSYHRQYDHLLMGYDENLKLKKQYLKNSTEELRGATWFVNILQQDKDYICLLDIFSSSFYVINKHNSVSKCYKLLSSNMMTEDIARNDYNLEDKDLIRNYVLSNGIIRGDITYKNKRYSFKIDLNVDKLDFSQKSSSYSFDCYYDGKYYKVLSPEDIKRIMESEPAESTDYYLKLREVIEKINHEISEYDNYYILKMSICNEE